MSANQLDSMFNPKSVAVFGASDTSGSVGALVFANLLSGGFGGRIVPVNPKHESVSGRPCITRLSDTQQHFDLAVIATPAPTVPGILNQCVEHDVRNAIILTAGFGEGDGAGNRLSREIAEIAKRGNLRFLGPNCVGLTRPWLGLNATFLNGNTPKGRLALISQSGALCSAISDWAGPNHLGFSALVSLGNALNIGFGDVMQFLATDPKTSAILLYVEGVRDARRFVSALRVASRSKPVVVLKSGRHSQSSKAAQTHTGALMGDDAVFDAALSQSGAVRAVTFGQLFAAAEILAANVRAKGNRLGIITNGGGAGVLAADRAGDLRLDLPKPSDKTLAILDKTLPAFWSRGNPVDILGDAPPESYAVAVAAAMEDPNFDGVLVMLTPQAMTDASKAAEAVVGAVTGERRKKPLLACWMGENSVAEGRRILSSNGIADFTTPERSVEAFSYLAQHHRNRQLALETPGPMTYEDEHDFEGARMIINAALNGGRSILSDTESKAVLRAFGIPVNTTLEADTAEEALVAGETVGFPVAMKINSPDITHKTDVGGVRLGIMDAPDSMLAFRDIVETAKSAVPDAMIKGVTVEAMAYREDAREIVVGASRDPVFGPVILFGAGGTMVEVLRDSAVALPPLNEVLARRLIHRTRVSKLLGGFRNRAAVDENAVINVILRISDMVCELPEIVELDINPLFAGKDGVLAVDARIRVARPPAKDGPYDHMAFHPYPRHLETEDRLADGTPLVIRPIRPEDADTEASFVRELSPAAKRFRFMGAMTELSPEQLVRFTQIDYRREMALVAIAERQPPRQIGVARYVINPDDTSCEFAIVVSDRVQNRGIGTRLMKALIEAARDHGLTRMVGVVLRSNEQMLDLANELGFTFEGPEDDPDVVRIELWL